MGIKVASLTAETVDVEVEFGGESAKVVVRPSGLTPELENAVSELGTGAGFVELLSRLLVSWEVLDDAGEPIPPTPDNLRKLPMMFLVEVTRQATEALAPKAPTA